MIRGDADHPAGLSCRQRQPHHETVTRIGVRARPAVQPRMRRGRLRFGGSELLSRQEGTRRAIKAIPGMVVEDC